MASRQEVGAVYAAAVVQGIVLVTFPAVAPIFTSAAHYGLSTTEYGGMFAPQAVAAIISSLLGAGLTRHLGGKRVLLIGLAADLLSLGLLFISQFVVRDHPLAYGLLLAATGALGIGFGFTVPALNTFTAAFFPEKVGPAILTLNALLGVGTALAPIFAAIFVGLGIWWGLPLLMIALTVALLIFSARLPFTPRTGIQSQPAPTESRATFESRATPINRINATGDITPESFEPPVRTTSIPPKAGLPSSSPLPVNRVEQGSTASLAESQTVAPARGFPARFWVYAAFALLYGICETLNGNWATVYLASSLGASTTLASFALTAFWVSVTGGRVLFAAIEKWCPETWTYRGLPLLLTLSFLATSAVPAGAPVLAIAAFALAGLGCSALLPLVISFGQGELKSMTAAVAGGLIGFYQIGYGLAAFGVGPLQSSLGVTLGAIYRASAVPALLLAALAFVIVGRPQNVKAGSGASA